MRSAGPQREGSTLDKPMVANLANFVSLEGRKKKGTECRKRGGGLYQYFLEVSFLKVFQNRSVFFEFILTNLPTREREKKSGKKENLPHRIWIRGTTSDPAQSKVVSKGCGEEEEKEKGEEKEVRVEEW
jgi:hypothetical protein